MMSELIISDDKKLIVLEVSRRRNSKEKQH